MTRNPKRDARMTEEAGLLAEPIDAPSVANPPVTNPDANAPEATPPALQKPPAPAERDLPRHSPKTRNGD
jgi:hypothetical protein